MKTILAVALLFTATPAIAKECYQHDENADWQIEFVHPGSDAEWVWRQGDKVINISTGSAGTGVPVRVAYDDEGNGWPYMYHKGALIVDMEIYEPVPCK